MRQGKIYIGTSGYSYPHWKGVFYPTDLTQKNWLDYYGENFTTLELNVTFYRLPEESSFANWHSKTPKGFVFAVKGSRYITHVKRIRNLKDSLATLAGRIQNLQEKLAVVLWQLPPRMKKDSERLEEFCRQLKTMNLNVGHAFEFRDARWLSDDVYDLLRLYNFALVISDSPKFPCSEEVTADFVYLRFHGGEELYGSKYSEPELKKWAVKLVTWQREGRDAYAYFNNDAHGYATENARTLNQLVQIETSR